MKKKGLRCALGVLLISGLSISSLAATPQAIQTKREALRIAIAAALLEPTIVGEIVAAGLAVSLLSEIQCDPTVCVFDARYAELEPPVVPGSYRPVSPQELERFFGAPVDVQTVELMNRGLRAQLQVSAAEWAALTTVFRIYSADLKGDEEAARRQRAHLASILQEQVPRAISEANSTWQALLARLEERGIQGPLVTEAQLNRLRDDPQALRFSDMTRKLMREYGMTEAQIEEQQVALLEPVEGLRGPASFAELVTRLITLNETFALTECACAPPDEAAVASKRWLYLGVGALILLALAVLLWRGRARLRQP